MSSEDRKVATIKDSLFGHAKASSNGDLGIEPRHLIFDREHKLPITFYTDLDLLKAADDTNTYKIAWLIESPEVHTKAYEDISKPEYYNIFDLVLTFDKKLLRIDSKFTFYAVGGCWIKPEDREVFDKTKDVSIIASRKTDLLGQRLRHDVIDKFGDRIDGVFGRGYKEIENKIEGLRDYRYSIVIENCRGDYYFTEKLIDCFVTGTVPIYWGCPSIGNFFDSEGIISFSSLEELDGIFSGISEQDYEKRLTAIRNNFKSAQEYTITEDYIYNNVILKNDSINKLLVAETK